MLVVVVLCNILVEPLSSLLWLEPVTLHGDRSGIIMAAGIHLQPPELFNLTNGPAGGNASNNLESHQDSEVNQKKNWLKSQPVQNVKIMNVSLRIILNITLCLPSIPR